MALSSVHALLAQAAPTAPAAGGAAAQPAPSLAQQLPFLLLMAGAFYFLMIAPMISQNKKRKEHDKQVAALEPGDEIISTGGIYGVVTSMKEDRLVLRVAESTKIELGRAFVQAVVRKAGAEKK